MKIIEHPGERLTKDNIVERLTELGPIMRGEEPFPEDGLLGINRQRVARGQRPWQVTEERWP